MPAKKKLPEKATQKKAPAKKVLSKGRTPKTRATLLHAQPPRTIRYRGVSIRCEETGHVAIVPGPPITTIRCRCRIDGREELGTQDELKKKIDVWKDRSK